MKVEMFIKLEGSKIEQALKLVAFVKKNSEKGKEIDFLDLYVKPKNEMEQEIKNLASGQIIAESRARKEGKVKEENKIDMQKAFEETFKNLFGEDAYMYAKERNR